MVFLFIAASCVVVGAGALEFKPSLVVGFGSVAGADGYHFVLCFIGLEDIWSWDNDNRDDNDSQGVCMCVV